MPWRKKTQRRVQLTATDLWGRTALTHSISSGREQLFDAVLRAVRQDVLDSEVKLLPYVVHRMFGGSPLFGAENGTGRWHFASFSFAMGRMCARSS